MICEASARRSIVDALRRLAQLGLNKGTSGNVSVRCEDGFWVSPTGVAYDRLVPDQVVRMRWDGSHDGAMLPSSEWRMHRDVLQARPEFGAVVHTHSPHATAVSILGHDLPAIHYAIAAAGGHDIRCARYATFGSAELGAAVVQALDGRRACLMAHHGALAAHADLGRAVALAVTVEEIAQWYLQVLPFGPPQVLGLDEMKRVAARFASYGQQTRDEP